MPSFSKLTCIYKIKTSLSGKWDAQPKYVNFWININLLLMDHQPLNLFKYWQELLTRNANSSDIQEVFKSHSQAQNYTLNQKYVKPVPKITT